MAGKYSFLALKLRSNFAATPAGQPMWLPSLCFSLMKEYVKSARDSKVTGALNREVSLYSLETRFRMKAEKARVNPISTHDEATKAA